MSKHVLASKFEQNWKVHLSPVLSALQDMLDDSSHNARRASHPSDPGNFEKIYFSQNPSDLGNFVKINFSQTPSDPGNFVKINFSQNPSDPGNSVKNVGC